MNSRDISALLLFDATIVEKCYGGGEQAGATDLYVRCTLRMLSNLNARMDSLKNAVDSGSLKEVVYFSHQLKNGFNAAGSPLLGELCGVIEREGRQEKLTESQQQVLEIQRLTGDFFEQLAAFHPNLAAWVRDSANGILSKASGKN